MTYSRVNEDEKKVNKLKKVALTRLLQLVGDDTTYEVRLGRSQSGHQVVKLFL